MAEQTRQNSFLNRRSFLKSLLTGGLSLTGIAAARRVLGGDPASSKASMPPPEGARHEGEEHENPFGAVGEVDHARNGFDPQEMLYDWDYGEVSSLPDGQTLREYEFVALDKEIEIAPGIFFPAWTYNGRVPGPSIRCVEGDRIRIHFRNAGSHPHTIHFHGVHPASMDGVPGIGAGDIQPGESTVYEFDALPFGCHLYHCHSTPLKRHIHKGLYGAFVVDPDPELYTGKGREIARTRNHQYPENQAYNEMMMVMNGFDTNFDDDNEVYAANTVAFAYMDRPIPIRGDQIQRVYLINTTEFDSVNSFHLHANFFDYYDHGTTLEPTLTTVDTISQIQGQRGILEFSFQDFEPGRYMFHAHQSEFAELGWMAFFDLQGEGEGS
ncbi:MAG: multicopper oxidase domain-containing protein [Anaerolineales bacterium]|nr:multicopper oxidase domain-containing protein [Anaerolineales bacterium]